MARNPTRIGRYDLLTTLATGGMGRIYLARATGPGGFERKVAIKTLELPVDADGAGTDPAIAMFLDEARLLAVLHHQHIASVFEVGRDDDGRHYMVLDYVDGVSAHDVLERVAQLGAALPLDFTLTVVSATASALHYTHTRKDAGGAPLGIVHRDVTPSNVMIGHDGAVKLIDFGIALAAGRRARTETGLVKGKVGYLSPEQVAGRDVDARADVFALGILLYELSTSHPAFHEPTELETMQRIKLGKVVRPSQLVSNYPVELEVIVMKALQVDPRDRFADADALRRALEALGHRLHFVLGDAAVTEVMAQLYEARDRGPDGQPASRASELEFEWAESDRDRTVRRDPGDLLAAMRAETANVDAGESVTNILAGSPGPAPVRSRKLRAATEAADALIVQTSDAFTTPATPVLVATRRPSVATPTVVESVAATPVAEPVAEELVAEEPVTEMLAARNPAGGKPAVEPVGEALVAEEPVTEMLVAKNSARGKPAVDQPVAATSPAANRAAAKAPRATAMVAGPKIGANPLLAQMRRSSRLRWIAASAVLVVLGVGGYVVMRRSSDAGSSAPPDAAAGSSAPPVPPPVAARPPPAPAAPLNPPPAARPPAPQPQPVQAPAPARVHVRIVTHPADATVLLDGKKLGHTPLDETVAAEPGKHVIKLRRHGYVTHLFDVELDADVAQDITLVPQKTERSRQGSDGDPVK